MGSADELEYFDQVSDTQRVADSRINVRRQNEAIRLPPVGALCVCAWACWRL